MNIYPNYNTNLLFKYKVGDIIVNSENQKFFVSRVKDHMYYTIVRLHNKKRLVLLKGQVNGNTKLCLSSTLKNL